MVLTVTSPNCKVKIARFYESLFPLASFHSCSMPHIENTAIWTSEFSQCVKSILECCLIEKKPLLLIFNSITILSITGLMFMRTYASSWVKRKGFYRKSELQMFLLISGGHIGGPKRSTNMVSPYKALQSCTKHFVK